MQPNTIKWNLLGMMNNSYYRVKLQVLEPQPQHLTNNSSNSTDGAPVIVFLHPVSQTGEKHSNNNKDDNWAKSTVSSMNQQLITSACCHLLAVIVIAAAACVSLVEPTLTVA
jgi:Mo-co oxidoreductase dimerisation domain